MALKNTDLRPPPLSLIRRGINAAHHYLSNYHYSKGLKGNLVPRNASL